jgi:hypothetical protein
LRRAAATFHNQTRSTASCIACFYRYKLVPEGVAREVDVPAARCAIVEGATMRKGGESADDEVFDIPDGS